MTVATTGCALVAAAGGAGVALAWFGDDARTAGNAVASGTVALTGIDPAANTVLPATTVRPGGPEATGIQTVGNGGSVGGALTVRVGELVKLTSNDLSGVLRLTVEECTTGSGATCGAPVTRYQGALTGATSAIALGALAPGEQKRLRVRVGWPKANDNTALYNDRTGIRLSWSLRTSA